MILKRVIAPFRAQTPRMRPVLNVEDTLHINL